MARMTPQNIALSIAAAALLCSGCRSQKAVESHATSAVDSIAVSAHHRTMLTLDSLMQHIDFSFDTLKVNIEQPVEYAEAPVVIRLTATKGRVVSRREAEHQQLEVFNRLDTVAYKASAAETSTEQSDTTRAYSPPDGTKILALSILLIAAILYFRLRK